jgi:hypothetical protein
MGDATHSPATLGPPRDSAPSGCASNRGLADFAGAAARTRPLSSTKAEHPSDMNVTRHRYST